MHRRAHANGRSGRDQIKLITLLITQLRLTQFRTRAELRAKQKSATSANGHTGMTGVIAPTPARPSAPNPAQITSARLTGCVTGAM